MAVHSPIHMKPGVWIAALVLCLETFAQQPSSDPNLWVRQAIEHELQAEQQDTSHWKFRLRNQKSNGNFEVDEVVETAQD